MVDDQVITLLVYSLPQLEFSFYQPVEGMITAGQMGSLPIQITNLSRKSVVLGNVIVTSPNGEMTNNSILVARWIGQLLHLRPCSYHIASETSINFGSASAIISTSCAYNSSLSVIANPP